MKNTLKVFIALLVLLNNGYSYANENIISYVNYAPDNRYSMASSESIINFNLKENIFSYGHNFGNNAPCLEKSADCIAFDFMAVSFAPEDAAVGSDWKIGKYHFLVSKKIDITLFGCTKSLRRIDVRNKGRQANSFLFDNDLGVVAIIVLNFENRNIPESIFFLEQKNGLFSKVQKIGRHIC